MSVRDISDVMDCSEATVRSRINYAKKALRKQVEELEDKGIKLRCVALLPFLGAVYSFEARSILVEDECALETEAGHDGEATRLKEEIDNILKTLQNNNAQSGGNNNEPQGNQGNPETKREQEIKNKLKQQQNDGYNERYYNKEFYEDYFGGSYSVGDGPVW